MLAIQAIDATGCGDGVATDPLLGTDPSFGAISERMMRSLVAGGLVSDEGAGGVARTLVETFAREIATFYEVLRQAHAAGYLDTAEGDSLEQVVALLGIERGRAGRLTGQVVLSRPTNASAAIVIPAGLRLMGRDAKGKPLPLLEVVAEAELAAGAREVTVVVAEVPGQETAAFASLPAHSIVAMPRPLLGVEEVDNPDPITRSGADETDEALRTRARAALRVGERSTAESLVAAAREAGVTRVTVREEGPGLVVVRVADPGLEGDSARIERVSAALRRAKAAGVQVRLELTRTVLFAPALTLTLRGARSRAEEAALLERCRRAIADVVNALEPGESIRRTKIEAVILAIEGVEELRLEALTETRPLAPDGSIAAADTSDRAEASGWRIADSERARVELDRLPPKLTVAS